jgi:hypothetical protein
MRRKRTPKHKNCSLRKTHPIGPLKICQGYCWDFDPCVELSKKEKEAGLDNVKGPYSALKNEVDPKGKFCSLCGKPIAKPETLMRNFKGLLMIHLKHKHFSHWKSYKKGEIPFEELFYTGSRPKQG